MADLFLKQGVSLGSNVVSKWKDMGDGTHALVQYTTGELQIGDVDVSSTNPLPVQTQGTTISVALTVTAGAYVAGDCVGGVLEFANAAVTSGKGGVVQDMIIVDDAGQDVGLELWLFDRVFTSPGDNAPWAATEDDLHNLVCVITTADGVWFETGTPSVASVEIGQRYDCAATSLFGQLVTRGTPTFIATDDVMVTLGLLQDG